MFCLLLLSCFPLPLLAIATPKMIMLPAIAIPSVRDLPEPQSKARILEPAQDGSKPKTAMEPIAAMIVAAIATRETTTLAITEIVTAAIVPVEDPLATAMEGIKSTFLIGGNPPN